MTQRRHTTLPYIPKPAPKEVPVREQMTHPENGPEHQHHDTRGQQHKPNHPIQTPQYSELYDTFGTVRGWRYVADGFAHGTITPTAGSTATANVTLTLPRQLRLSQWPDGVQAYLCIHSFGIAPQVAPTTGGALEVLYIDQSGYTAPLGDFWSASGGNSGQDILIPSSVTDPGQSNLVIGQIQVQLQPGGATAVAYNWSMGIGIAYLLPNIKGYKPEFRETTHEGKDAIHTYIHH